MANSNKATGSGDAAATGAGLGNPGPSTDARREPHQAARGQKVSRERGSAQRSKKNPGKRATQGGSSR